LRGPAVQVEAAPEQGAGALPGDYFPPDVWQPHWQLVSAQLHAFAGQPQEQLPHTQAAFFAVFF
jgi:hypothetical protein